MVMLEVIVVALVGYSIGSIPFAVIIARRHGVDILKAGSGNPGATNVKRVLGSRAGNLCFALDFFKGVLAAGLPTLQTYSSVDPLILGLVGLVAGIVGHSLSMFLKFRGGKGVAVTMGGLSVLLFWSWIVGLLVWLTLFYTTRYVSLASLGFGLSLPLSAWFFGFPPASIIFSILLAVLIVVRHRSNILRLWQGKENQFAKN